MNEGYAPRMKDGKPYPPDAPPKPDHSRNPTSAALKSQSEEALDLNRTVTALRGALKLVAVHAGRVVASCTGAPIPAEEAYADGPDAPEPGSPRVTADAYSIHAACLLKMVNDLDQEFYAFQANTLPQIDEAKAGRLK